MKMTPRRAQAIAAIGDDLRVMVERICLRFCYRTRGAENAITKEIHTYVKRKVREEREACRQIAVDAAWRATDMKGPLGKGFHESAAKIAVAILKRGGR